MKLHRRNPRKILFQATILLTVLVMAVCTHDDNKDKEIKQIDDGQRELGNRKDTEAGTLDARLDRWETTVPDSFLKTQNSMLRVRHGKYDFKAFISGSVEACAARCLAAKLKVCRSFLYNPRKRACFLSSYSTKAAGTIVASPIYDYYEKQTDDTDPNECKETVPVPCEGQKNCVKVCDGIQLKLVGSLENAGTVVITYQGKDGVVCDSSWSKLEASVVCRMLGYNGTGVATISNLFNYTTERLTVLLDRVQCSGNETSLLACQRSPWLLHQCRPSEIAGVRCHHLGDEDKLGPVPRCGQRPYNQKETKRQNGVIDVSARLFKDLSDLPKAYNKIVGGEQADPGAYPWLARLHRVLRIASDGSEIGMHACGAGILSEFWLISAAHCFVGRRKSEWRIVTGDYGIYTNESSEQRWTANTILVHEGYDSRTKENDIALIKIQPDVDGRGIKFNNYVQPLCMPDPRGSLPDGTMCFISGWGYTVASSSDGTHKMNQTNLPAFLRSARVPILSNSSCEHFYDSQAVPSDGTFIASRMLCAGYQEGGVDTCEGDSGGPLVCNIEGVYTIAGVTAWGRGCALPNLPGVYTRVSAYLDWIRSKIQLHSQDRLEGRLPIRPGAQ